MLPGQATGPSFNSSSEGTNADVLEDIRKLPRKAASSRRLDIRSLNGWLVVLAILFCVPVRLVAVTQPAAKNVLVLHNWANLPPSWALTESNVRTRVPGPVSFYSVSVENPRFDEEVYRESLAETLHRGFAGVKLDVLVAASYPVLQFAMQYRDKMFPGVPIVFTDVGGPREEKIWPGVTGVISRMGIGETIDLALQLHPDTKVIAIITGLTEWDKHWLAVAHSELLRHQDKVREIDIIGPASHQIIDEVAELPPSTVVLFQLRPDDSTHPAVEPIDVLAEVARRLPTYSAWEGLSLNRGGVGGAYRNFQKEAVLDGEIVARVLSGERPENIPIAHDSELQFRVDWRALQRWHIPESALPPGTLILYRPPTLWEQYRRYVIVGSVVVAALLLLIAGLLWERARKRKAEAVLRESEARFRVMADTTPSLIWMCDPQGEITYLNERRIMFTGPDANAGFGDTWIGFIHPEDVKNVLDALGGALQDHRPFSKEYRLRRSDGVYRWMFDVASPRVNGDRSFAGFIGSAIDITDQKLAQQALEKVSGRLIEAQEKERSRIARDLHDDICQRLALLSMELEQAKRISVESPETTQRRLQEIRQHCTEIAGDVQSLSHQLHSSRLDYLGAVAAIKGFCEEFARQHDVDISFEHNSIPEHLPKDISLCLFRVAQEALHNAVKYSGTSQFSVEMKGTAKEVQLVVRDAGAGFDVEEAKRNRGLGLVSMQERVNLVYGRLSVESKPKEGTTIVASVPLLATNGSLANGEGEQTEGMTGAA
jgi:PAS domain S-box-containing protein